MITIEKVFLQNKAWAQEKTNDDPHYFERMAAKQNPEFLWIGCSDSRVPANEVTSTHPGQMFVHRNIANLVVSTDMNLMSVLQYAVQVLKVQHVIVCGHYGCGGIEAAFSGRHYGLINKWLHHIKDVYHDHKAEVNALHSKQEKVNRLVELNVLEQTRRLSETFIVQQAWKEENIPHLHGWVYDMNNGLLKSLVEIAPNSPIDPVYQLDFSAE